MQINPELCEDDYTPLSEEQKRLIESEEYVTLK